MSGFFAWYRSYLSDRFQVFTSDFSQSSPVALIAGWALVLTPLLSGPVPVSAFVQQASNVVHFWWKSFIVLVKFHCNSNRTLFVYVLTAMVFVYDFHPGAETMMNRHFGSSPRSSDTAFGNHSASVATAYHNAGLSVCLSLCLSHDTVSLQVEMSQLAASGGCGCNKK